MNYLNNENQEAKTKILNEMITFIFINLVKKHNSNTNMTQDKHAIISGLNRSLKLVSCFADDITDTLKELLIRS
jgi:hypothetical protein